VYFVWFFLSHIPLIDSHLQPFMLFCHRFTMLFFLLHSPLYALLHYILDMTSCATYFNISTSCRLPASSLSIPYEKEGLAGSWLVAMAGLPDSLKAEPEPDLSQQSEGVHTRATLYTMALLCPSGEEVFSGFCTLFSTVHVSSSTDLRDSNQLTRYASRRTRPKIEDPTIVVLAPPTNCNCL